MDTKEWERKKAEWRAEQPVNQQKAHDEGRFWIGPQDGQSCATCRFWKGYPYLDQSSPFLGKCQRHAPAAPVEQHMIAPESPSAIDWSHHRFPTTYNLDWCGDYAAALSTRITRESGTTAASDPAISSQVNGG